MQADDAVVVANEFFASLDNLPNEVSFITQEIRSKDEEIDTIRARMQGRMQNILKHARSSGTSNKENKTTSSPASTPVSIGPLNAKDQDSMAHIALEWAKIDALSEDKTALADRLARLVTRHRERGRDEWRKIAGDEAADEFEIANPDWTSDGLAALAMGGGGAGGSVVGTPGIMAHLNGTLSAGGSAGMFTGSFNGIMPTPGTANFRSAIGSGGASAGLSPLAMEERIIKKRKANGSATAEGSGYFSNMGPPSAPGFALPGTHPSLPHGQGHVHASASINNYTSPSATSTWANGQAPHRNQYSAGANKRNRVQSVELEESFLVESEMDMEPGEEGGDDRLYCTCNQKSWGEMIGCDNEACPREWFHLKCVNVTLPTPETWYCAECQVTLGLADSSGTKKIKGRKK